MENKVRKNSVTKMRKVLSEMSTPENTSLISSSQSFFEINPQDPLSLKNLEGSNDRYELNHVEVIGSKLTAMQRYKMMKWLLNESDKRHYTREVFANTCYYLDLYVSKAPQVGPENLQLIALGALLIAVKMEGSRFPEIGGEISKNKILEYEKLICLTLNYFLNPPTYVTLLDKYLALYDNFSMQRGLNIQSQNYLAKSGKGFQKSRVLYEKMESINMVATSLRYSYSDLVLNLFFLQNRMNLRGVNPAVMDPSSLLLFIQQSYTEKDQYRESFHWFLKHCLLNDFYVGSLCPGIGVYLAPFLGLPIDPHPPARMSINYEMYTRLQTVSPESQKCLDKLAKTLK